MQRRVGCSTGVGNHHWIGKQGRFPLSSLLDLLKRSVHCSTVYSQVHGPVGVLTSLRILAQVRVGYGTGGMGPRIARVNLERQVQVSNGFQVSTQSRIGRCPDDEGIMDAPVPVVICKDSCSG